MADPATPPAAAAAAGKPDTLTQNGALAFSSAGSACLDLFFRSVRGVATPELDRLLSAAWAESPIDCVRLIFQTRDCRGGKGEKAIFVHSLKWLLQNHPETFKKNLVHVPFYGTWKDLLALVGTEAEKDVLQLFAEQLRRDLALLEQGADEVSLCAKWVPTEKHSVDSSSKVTSRLARLLYPDSPCPLKMLRTKCHGPLRAKLQVTERKMCAGEWDSINFSSVPSRCMHLQKKAFMKHNEAGFKQFLLDAAAGKVKIQGKQLFPHELTNQCRRLREVDYVIELQWKVLIDGLRELGTLSRCTVLSDVSGSMSGMPMDISIALGLLISELAEEPFRNLVITFEETPRLVTIVGDTLLKRVSCIRGIPWGGSTNFQAALDLILDKAIEAKLSQDQMPNKMFVISDMEFNVADGNYSTNHERATAKFREHGYEPPTIVYWNVNASASFPATGDTPGVMLLSGYSPSLLKLVMDNPELQAPEDAVLEAADSASGETSGSAPAAPAATTPLETLHKALQDERYARLEL